LDADVIKNTLREVVPTYLNADEVNSTAEVAEEMKIAKQN
jgi:hypothetical protein